MGVWGLTPEKLLELPRFIIFSSVHRAFSLSLMCMHKTLTFKNFCKSHEVNYFVYHTSRNFPLHIRGSSNGVLLYNGVLIYSKFLQLASSWLANLQIEIPKCTCIKGYIEANMWCALKSGYMYVTRFG